MSALGDRIGAVLELDPAAEAVEFERRWWTWGDLARTAGEVDRALAPAPAGACVGVLLRNRPTSIGFVLGVLRAGACLVVLNPMVGADRLGADLASLDLAAVAGDPEDLAAAAGALEGVPAVLSVPSLGVPGTVTLGRPARRDAVRPGVAVRMLTSGTTGPPKRVDLTYRMLERVMEGAKHYEAQGRAEVALRRGVVIVNAPLVHLGGLFRVLQGVLDGRRLALLPKFTVDGWVDAVRRHRPKTVSLVPTALRMVLDADVDPAALDSVQSVVSGTAPLDPVVAEAFTARFGIPVLTSYAATEFGGGVAGWNLADHQRHWSQKRGSVGRAHAGCELRTVDPESGTPLGPDEVGVLEVKARQLEGTEWVRTTDLARIDADGFIWIVGRADQTIVRGGFKVQPDVVQAALERLPGVRAAAVVGVPDDRLGEVPVAIVEPGAGKHLDDRELLDALRAVLAPYEVPAEIRVVAALPRTASAKVDVAAVRSMVASRATGTG